MPYDLPPLSYIDAYKPGIDMTLVRENLKLTVTQRLQQLQAFQAAAEELRRAGKAARAAARDTPSRATR